MKPAKWSWRLGAGTLVAAGTAGSMLLLSAVAPAGAATGPAPGKVAVPQGITAASLHGTRISAAPASMKETVSFVLKLRNASTLKSDVEAGMKHGFLSVSKFASHYGQSKANVAALEKYLKGKGIKSSAYADGLDISTTGTVAAYNSALSVTQSMYRIKAIPAHGNQAARAAMTIHGTASKALLPASLAKFVFSILGLTPAQYASSDAVHTLTPENESAPHSLQLGNRTPGSFASQYGLTALYKKGFEGQGQTLGIITFASVRPSDATHFWSKVVKIKTKANRITLDNVDGGSGPVSANAGSGETTLDVEQSGGLAPQANIIVYQAPNSDYGSADAWFDAASQNKAATISTSWGESEILNEAIAANHTEAATYGGIFDEAGLEMAAQGQSAFDAAGDGGAYDDIADPVAFTELSVDNPANSPWITAGGGTTNKGQIPLFDTQGNLAVKINIAAQRAWGWDYFYPHFSLFQDPDPSSTTPFPDEASFVESTFYAAGGGGGYSVSESRPTYQSKIKNIGSFTAVPYVTPNTGQVFSTNPSMPGASCTLATPPVVPCLPTAWAAWATADSNTPPALVTGTASGRAVPDISADADPYTGYELYYIDFPKSVGHLEFGWGGTSFVAPQLNGSAAVIDSYLHHRAGFWNPAIYKFAVHSYTPFTPLNSASSNNDNLYYTGTAGAKYNPATGLGVPNLGKLAVDFKYHS